MARDCYETTIAVADIGDYSSLKSLEGVKVSVVPRGATDIPNSLIDIYQDHTDIIQGPDPKTGATGTNPFTTGSSGAVRFWAEGPAKLDIVFEDTIIPARIDDRTSWDCMPVSTTFGPTAPPAQPQTAGSTHYRTDYQALYFSTGTSWLLVGSPTPVGQIASFGLASVVDIDGVTRWLHCNGAACTSAHPLLRSALQAAGNPYGVSGSDPKLPDIQGRVPMGSGFPTGAAGATSHPLGSANGGEEKSPLTWQNLPGQTAHIDPSPGNWIHVVAAGSSDYKVAYAPTAGGNLYGGGATGHNNLQPYTIVNWFIKARY